MAKQPIPKNIEECCQVLLKLLPPYEVVRFKGSTDPHSLHFGFGRIIRNEWGLWSGSPLKDYFRSLGIEHADDMSGMILRSFWRYLNGMDLDIEGQASYYKEYWREVGEQPHFPDTQYVTEWDDQSVG